MKILVIDGQGGKIGQAIISGLISAGVEPDSICAVGTNSNATAAMLKAGAQSAATGENPVVVNARTADIITGPVGIVIADSLMGEVTPAMALAVGRSGAKKVLVPVNRCNTLVVGTVDMPFAEHIKKAVNIITALS